MINFHPEFEGKGVTEPITIEQEKELLIQQTKEQIDRLLAMRKEIKESGDTSPKALELLGKIDMELNTFRKYIQDLI